MKVEVSKQDNFAHITVREVFLSLTYDEARTLSVILGTIIIEHEKHPEVIQRSDPSLKGTQEQTKHLTGKASSWI